MSNWVVTLAMLGWIPVVALAFLVLSPPRAVVLCYFAGWLFLPIATLPVPGLPDYSKPVAVASVIFIAIAVFDSRRLQAFRFELIDLPMAIYCLTPAASSLTNDLGIYDAFSSALTTTLTWGLPWLTGRLYFSSPDGMQRLAVGLLLGGLVYAPLCLWEIRMSPQLHATIYGYHQHDWIQTLRLGGYRPMVFMNHGLMVGLWMTAASLMGFALWTGGVVRRVWGMPLWLAVPGLFAVTVLCKSFGALILLLAGALSLLTMRSLRLSLPMGIMLCLPLTWVAVRVTGTWSGAGLTSLADSVDAERSSSMEYRIRAEDSLMDKALLKPLFGWGGYGRAFTTLATATSRGDRVVTDSLWIITLGKHGLVGLGSVMLILVLPVVVLWRRIPPRLWATRPGATVAWGLALVLTMYTIDNLANNMENPIYLLIAGGLAGLPALQTASRARAASARAAPPSRPVGRALPTQAPTQAPTQVPAR